MDYKKLADMLFPDVTLTLDDLEKMYPERKLEKGAIVTRFAPSPTGFLHIGSVFTCLVASNFAKKSGGKFILRIEDTDQNRLIPGAIGLIIDGLKRYKIEFDEGRTEDGKDFGDYGTYMQSLRKPIYMAMAKYLVSIGKAYPCFCDEQTTARDKMIQEANKELIGYYGAYAHCRDLTLEEVEENLRQGKKFAIRLRCESNADNKIIVEDAIRGTLKLSDNFKDVVILKRDFLPPYNFAHVCDDHFMRVNLVVRGDEYIPSIEEVESVREYLLTVANSNFEEWRKQNPDRSNEDFVVSLDKMSKSGALFDMPKLNDVSKNVISKFTADYVYDLAYEWAERYDKEFAEIMKNHKDYTLKIMSIERGTPKPRKDIAKWNDIKSTYFYFYKELFNPQKVEDYGFDLTKFSLADIKEICSRYASAYTQETDKQVWFDKIKHLATDIGFADDMKAYKANPANFKGHYGDVSTILRVALTTKTNTPDLFEIMNLLGKDEVVSRLQKVCKL